MFEIVIPLHVFNRLLAVATMNHTEEICGVMGGYWESPQRGIVKTMVSVKNIATQPDIMFQMQPREQVRAMLQIANQGQVLVAIYHSHPCGPAAPSTTDIMFHAYPQAVMLICFPGEHVLNDTDHLLIDNQWGVGVWRIVQGEVTPVRIILHSD